MWNNMSAVASGNTDCEISGKQQHEEKIENVSLNENGSR